jgi:hypothetical protein
MLVMFTAVLMPAHAKLGCPRRTRGWKNFPEEKMTYLEFLRHITISLHTITICKVRFGKKLGDNIIPRPPLGINFCQIND